eukprot:6178232-Pleurochrysis_carterae.AAC.1
MRVQQIAKLQSPAVGLYATSEGGPGKGQAVESRHPRLCSKLWQACGKSHRSAVGRAGAQARAAPYGLRITKLSTPKLVYTLACRGSATMMSKLKPEQKSSKMFRAKRTDATTVHGLQARTARKSAG